MTPNASTFTPPASGLSRSTATYFASASLPPASLPKWSLDHSCTTFGAVVAPEHPRSSRLIDDDPDTEEEDHIRGIKRNRSSMSRSSPSKRRCYPLMLPLKKHPSKTPDPGVCDPPSFERSNPESTTLLLKSFSKTTHTLPLPFTSSTSNLDESNFSDEISESFNEISESSSEFLSRIDGTVAGNDDYDVAGPPKFRRRSTIRDSFDLAASVEEFKDFL